MAQVQNTVVIAGVEVSSKVYDTAAKAKARRTVLDKVSNGHVIREVEGGFVVITAQQNWDIESAIALAAAAEANLDKEAAPAAERAAYPWLKPLVARIRAQGLSANQLKVEKTPNRLALRTEAGKTVTWFTKQEYVDVTLTALALA